MISPNPSRHSRTSLLVYPNCRRGADSYKGRALEASKIRWLFSCSPLDPRYRILECLSSKFRLPHSGHERRAALILNRFSRSLNIMYATHAISSIIGLNPNQIQHRSFYDCLDDSCVEKVELCLEEAKTNDTTAYFRFWSKDPRLREELEEVEDDYDYDEIVDMVTKEKRETKHAELTPWEGGSKMLLRPGMQLGSKTCMEESDEDYSSDPNLDDARLRRSNSGRLPSVELEAVASCSSDGLILVIRKARPPIPGVEATRTTPTKVRNYVACRWRGDEHRNNNHNEFNDTILSQPSRSTLQDYWPPPQPFDSVGLSPSCNVAVLVWTEMNGNISTPYRGAPMDEFYPTRDCLHWLPFEAASTGNGAWRGSGSQRETIQSMGNHGSSDEAGQVSAVITATDPWTGLSKGTSSTRDLPDTITEDIPLEGDEDARVGYRRNRAPNTRSSTSGANPARRYRSNYYHRSSPYDDKATGRLDKYNQGTH